jgi:hypothetical protein
VLQHLMRVGDIEGGVVERERMDVGDPEVDIRAGSFRGGGARECQLVRPDLGRGDFGDESGEIDCDRARSSSRSVGFNSGSR